MDNQTSNLKINDCGCSPASSCQNVDYDNLGDLEKIYNDKELSKKCVKDDWWRGYVIAGFFLLAGIGAGWIVLSIWNLIVYLLK
jgi:hypothetical protein